MTGLSRLSATARMGSTTAIAPCPGISRFRISLVARECAALTTAILGIRPGAGNSYR